MQLKEKTNRFMILLTLAALLLGLGIQLGLAYARQRTNAAKARRVTEAVMRPVLAEAEARGRELEAERKKLEKLPAKKARELARQHPELLLIVNPWNPLPEGYEPQLQTVIEEYQMDVRCADALWQMIQDCQAAGNAAYICSAYRTQAVQQELYTNKILRLLDEGVSMEDAPAVAAESVAVPGTSEHQLGLAADIIDEHYPNLDKGQEETGTQKWLMENCWRYGFLLRYPNGTTDITGIIYEPWHYRYVGVDYAKEITDLGVTLEEYVAMRRGR